MLAVMRNQHIGSLYQQKSKRYVQFPILKMSVNAASKIVGLINKVIGKYFAHCYPYQTYRQPL